VRQEAKTRFQDGGLMQKSDLNVFPRMGRGKDGWVELYMACD